MPSRRDAAIDRDGFALAGKLADAKDLLREFVTEARAYQSPEIDECPIMGPLLKRSDALLAG